MLDEIRREEGEITPEQLLEVPFQPTDRAEDYEGVKKSLDFYGRDRERFCYIQSNGIFELNNGFLASKIISVGSLYTKRN
ncbi:MAG: hypothetical protein ACLR23_15045 [Clostridia bacterium]